MQSRLLLKRFNCGIVNRKEKSMLQAVYQAHLLEQYRNPKNKGLLSHADFSTDLLNPSCGDTVAVSARIQESIIVEIGFEGAGCVISQATASMLYQEAKGKTVDELLAYGATDIQKLIGITLGPVRLKCALLPLEALHKGILHYKAQHSILR